MAKKRAGGCQSVFLFAFIGVVILGAGKSGMALVER
jgi:hypothetical protein